jgi:peptide/nickel transport system permease protein
MSRYLVRRAVEAVPVLFAISIVGFLIVRLAPGDPASLLADLTQLSPEQQHAYRIQLGLEDPLPIQYVRMLAALLSGTLLSLRSGQPTLELVGDALPVTVLLLALALAVGTVTGVAGGALAAWRPHAFADTALTLLALFGLSLPQFWLGLLLITVFAANLHWLPAGGIAPPGSQPGPESLMHLVMPTLVLAAGTAATLVRFTRSSMLETLAQDYVRTARGKGLDERAVLFGHALRNSLVTVTSLVGVLVPIMLSGIVIVESVFGLPGLGQLTVAAALNRDYPVVFTTNLVAAVLVLLSSLATDVVYTLVDPRVGFE